MIGTPGCTPVNRLRNAIRFCNSSALGLHRPHQRLFFLGDAGDLIERERVNHAFQVLQGKVECGPASRESAQAFAHRAAAPSPGRNQARSADRAAVTPLESGPRSFRGRSFDRSGPIGAPSP